MENPMKPTVYAPFLSIVVAACNSLYSPSNSAPPGPSFAVIRAQGDSLTVADTLNKFRAALGGSLNAPNSAPADSGRREINWDGVPAALTNVDTFPATFFNVNSKRGVLITSGEAALDATSTDVSADGTQDLVVMDDFVYGEPQPLPQTSSYSARGL